MPFLIILEIEKTGYIIDVQNSLSKAKNILDRITTIAHNYYFSETKDVYNPLENYKSYIIRNELYISRPCKQQISNGTISTYIFEMEKYWKNIDSFIYERELSSDIFMN